MEMQLMPRKKGKQPRIMFAFLMTSLLYKLAIPSTLDLAYFSSIMNLPYSSVSKYTYYIYVLQFPLLGIIAQMLILFLVLAYFRGKLIAIRPKAVLFWFEALIMLRICSYLMFSGASFSTYDLIEQFLLLGTAMCVGSFESWVFEEASEKVLKFLEVFGVVCALTAILYYYQISGTQIVIFRNYRISGIYPDAVSVVFVYGLAIFSVFHRLVSKKAKKHVAISLIELTILLFGGLISGSRSFFVFLAIAIALTLFSLSDSKRIRLLATVIAILALMAYSLLDDVFLIDVETLSDASRANKIQIAFRTFLEHPILGVGTSNYRIYEAAAGFKGTNPHNMFFEVLCENGIVGIIVYLILVIKTIRLLYGIKGGKQLNVTAACLLLWFTISMIVGVFSNQFLMTVLIVLLNCIENEKRTSVGPRGHKYSLRKIKLDYTL